MLQPDMDVMVIGAGVVGLAIGRSLALEGRDVVVVDRHPTQGMETSSRNSEVIHAGIYYAPGSLKAELCVRGRDLLYRYAAERGVPFRRCGKLILARGEGASEQLGKIAERSAAVGAGILQPLSREDIAAYRYGLRADAGLLSPLTGIIDSHQLMFCYLADIEERGGLFVPNCEVRAIERKGSFFEVELAVGGKVTARYVVNAAGLHSGSLAEQTRPLGARFKPRIRYARGCYLKPSKSVPFEHLVYPLPTQASLGVHATIDLAGSVRFGPDVEWIGDPFDYAVDPARAAEFKEAISDFFPAIADMELLPDYAGIRPKLVGPGESPADFRIDGPSDHGLEGLVALHGIESPGLTSSLAIGQMVTRRLFEPALARARLSARG